MSIAADLLLQVDTLLEDCKGQRRTRRRCCKKLAGQGRVLRLRVAGLQGCVQNLKAVDVHRPWRPGAWKSPQSAALPLRLVTLTPAVCHTAAAASLTEDFRGAQELFYGSTTLSAPSLSGKRRLFAGRPP